MRKKHGKKLNSLKKYVSLYWEFFKIGMFTVGGGAAMIPQIQQVAVKDKGWMNEDEMLDCIAVCQAMPGVIAINSGTYIGRKIGGIRGSIAATTGVITPSFIIIVLAVTILGAIGENHYVVGAFTGVKAAVCGLILVTAVRLGKQSLKSAFQWFLAVAAFVVIGIFVVNAIWALIAGAVLGIIHGSVTAGAVEKKDEQCKSEEADE